MVCLALLLGGGHEGAGGVMRERGGGHEGAGRGSRGSGEGGVGVINPPWDKRNID